LLRPPSLSTFAAIALTLGTATLIYSASGRTLTLAADTPALWVFAAALAAVALALGIAQALRLVDLLRAGIAAPRDPAIVADELIDLVELSRREGLLAAAVDPRAASHPSLRCGIHLLMRDADDKLIRSTLDADTEISLRRVCNSRASVARACRVSATLLTMTAAAAAVFMAGRGFGPSTLTFLPAALLLASVSGFILWHCISEPLVSLLYRRNVADTFAASAAIEAALAMHAGDSTAQARARMARLLPTDTRELEAATAIRAAA